MLRRMIGLAMLLFGLTGIAISIAGAKIGRQVVDELGSDLGSSLQMVSDSLDRLEASLLLAKATMGDVGDGVVNAEAAMQDLARSADDAQPLLEQISVITTDEVPSNIESLQEAIPGIVQVAAIIDDSLTSLSEFRIDQTFLGFTLQFDLGIEYDPELPFDESVELVGDSLDGLPEQLRDLKTNLDASRENLAILSRDLGEISDNLNAINGRISETNALIDAYLSVVLDINDRTRLMRASIVGQLDNAKRGVTMISLWMGLAQLAPLYLGWELFRGRRLR